MARSTTPKAPAKTPAKTPAKAPAPGRGSKLAAAQAASRTAGGRKPTRFLREVRTELGKVTWPPRQELVQATVVVLVAIAIAASYIGILDLVWSNLVKLARLG